MGARKNGGGMEAILEKILEELRSHGEQLKEQGSEMKALRHDLNEKFDKLDARLDLMALGYRDLRERVTGLEKP